MGRLLVNGRQANIPTSLSEITLQQRIDYQRQHGDELDEKLKVLLEMEDEIERGFAIADFVKEKAFRTASFFANVTIDAIKESQYELDIIKQTAAANKVLFEQEDEMELEREFVFKGELWYLSAPELKNGSKMKFEEVTDSKQMVEQMYKLGANQWEAALPLAAVYLRRKDEEYHESFLYEGSERQELMKDLPMDIAMQVLFFLTPLVNIFLNTFQSSGLQRLNQAADIQKSISRNMDGFISLPA